MADTLTEPQRAWIEALRSGEYKQTTEMLARLDDGEPVGFCCLGVACELAKQAGIVTTSSIDYDGVECRTYNGPNSEREWTALPAEVRDWLGMTGKTGAYGGPDAQTSLASNNDAGETFERIADIIESRPEGLFA